VKNPESTSILLIGAGGHCKSCINLIDSIPEFKVKGIIDRPGSSAKDVLGHKVLGTDDEMESLFGDSPSVLISVGQIKTPKTRIKLFEKANSMGAVFPVLKSPMSCISDHSSIDSGTVVLHHVIVNASVKIGTNCIINTKALIEHDSEIGSHCHVSTAAIINGGVIVEDRCFIGSGAIVHEGVKIGEGSVISAGSIVRQDLSKGTLLK
jgi:sugar O-acyltransferase (sialic acid O-acetyltransferase NeuD family)